MLTVNNHRSHNYHEVIYRIGGNGKIRLEYGVCMCGQWEVHRESVVGRVDM